MKKSYLFLIAMFIGVASVSAEDQTASVAKVKFNYCFTTYGDWVSVNIGSCRLPYTWNGQSFDSAGDKEVTLAGQNYRGCDSIARLHLTTYDCLVEEINKTVLSTQLPYIWEGDSCKTAGTYYSEVFVDPSTGKDKYKKLNLSVVSIPKGAVGGLFTAGEDKHQILFSKGSLRYQANGQDGKSHWCFADHQYDLIGNNPGNTVLTNRSTMSNFIDRFAWGTSGYKDKMPYDYSTSSNGADYAVGEADITKEAGNGRENYDWGVYNTIENTEGDWRTPTVSELEYIQYTRPGADTLFALASINGMMGLVLLPDNWKKAPSSCSGFKYGWNTFTFNAPMWSDMEALGAVFIPAAGYSSSSPNTSNNYGQYKGIIIWTSQYMYSNAAYAYSFEANAKQQLYLRSYCCAVRLVQVFNAQ